MVFKEEPDSEGYDDYDPENGDSDYEPQRKPRKRTAAASLRKPKMEKTNEEGGDDCDSKNVAEVPADQTLDFVDPALRVPPCCMIIA